MCLIVDCRLINSSRLTIIILDVNAGIDYIFKQGVSEYIPVFVRLAEISNPSRCVEELFACVEQTSKLSSCVTVTMTGEFLGRTFPC